MEHQSILKEMLGKRIAYLELKLWYIESFPIVSIFAAIEQAKLVKQINRDLTEYQKQLASLFNESLYNSRM